MTRDWSPDSKPTRRNGSPSLWARFIGHVNGWLQRNDLRWVDVLEILFIILWAVSTVLVFNAYVSIY